MATFLRSVLRARSRIYWIWGAALTAVYAATVSRDTASNDVRSAALASWRLAATGRPWFDGYAFDPDQYIWQGMAASGHVTVFRAPAVIAAGVPGYLVSGGGSFSLLPSSLTAAGIVVLALVLLGGSLGARFDAPQRLVSLAVLALCTPVWSVAADGMWPHTLTILGIGGMAWAGAHDRWWLAGVFGGVALWARLHSVVILVVLCVGLALWRRRPMIAVKAGTTSAVMLALVTLWSHWMYGVWSPSGPYATIGQVATGGTGAVDGGLRGLLVNEVGLWLSPDRGLIVWTPVLLLFVVPVVRSWRELPDWSRLLLVGGFAYTCIQGALNGFAGGSGYYGYRLTLEMLVCCFPVCVFSAAALGRRARAVVGPLVGLQLAVISIGAYSNGFLLPELHPWRQSSAVTAVQLVPLIGVWFVLGAILGGLAFSVARDRGLVGPWPAATAASRGLDERPGDRLHQAQRRH